MKNVFVITHIDWTDQINTLAACSTLNDAVKYIQSLSPDINFTVELDNKDTWDVVGSDRSYYQITRVKLI